MSKQLLVAVVLLTATSAHADSKGFWCMLIGDNAETSVCTKPKDKCELVQRAARRFGGATISSCAPQQTVWATRYKMETLDEHLFATKAHCEAMRDVFGGKEPCREKR